MVAKTLFDQSRCWSNTKGENITDKDKHVSSALRRLKNLFQVKNYSGRHWYAKFAACSRTEESLVTKGKTEQLLQRRQTTSKTSCNTWILTHHTAIKCFRFFLLAYMQISHQFQIAKYWTLENFNKKGYYCKSLIKTCNNKHKENIATIATYRNYRRRSLLMVNITIFWSLY